MLLIVDGPQTTCNCLAASNVWSGMRELREHSFSRYILAYMLNEFINFFVLFTREDHLSRPLVTCRRWRLWRPWRIQIIMRASHNCFGRRYSKSVSICGFSLLVLWHWWRTITWLVSWSLLLGYFCEYAVIIDLRALTFYWSILGCDRWLKLHVVLFFVHNAGIAIEDLIKYRVELPRHTIHKVCAMHWVLRHLAEGLTIENVAKK